MSGVLRPARQFQHASACHTMSLTLHHAPPCVIPPALSLAVPPAASSLSSQA
eukprot:CAMPEP_0175376176 /NCGR_PEP_ID=MMETSP0095-20121207/24142_1 /TAXON_ID=311494 /ORGANISM="Alexandrium monilatum, Strain CCMP3105" /LENGTH=51 /DNA_ID=CAMNT_0016674455 /DNA_START=46 /DNA_END=201 /DNA_ORIENTATION=+